jgi:hypothetical protein
MEAIFHKLTAQRLPNDLGKGIMTAVECFVSEWASLKHQLLISFFFSSSNKQTNYAKAKY